MVVGLTYNKFPDNSYTYQAFKWTATGGIVGLDFLGSGTQTEAKAVSGDGTIIGGEAYNGFNAFKAVIWDDTGLHDFQDILTGQYGVNMAGWGRLSSINAISKDGRTFAGIGYYQGQDASWVVTIPEPATIFLLTMGGIALSRRKKKYGSHSI